MYKISNKFFLVLILLSFAGISQAEVYKCKNKDGIINFTSVPCGKKNYGIKRPKKKVEVVTDEENVAEVDTVDERVKKEKELQENLDKKKQEEKLRKEKLAEHEKNILRNCAKAKNDLIQLQNNATEEQKLQAEDEIKRRITYWCRE